MHVKYLTNAVFWGAWPRCQATERLKKQEEAVRKILEKAVRHL